MNPTLIVTTRKSLFLCMCVSVIRHPRVVLVHVWSSPTSTSAMESHPQAPVNHWNSYVDDHFCLEMIIINVNVHLSGYTLSIKKGV